MEKLHRFMWKEAIKALLIRKHGMLCKRNLNEGNALWRGMDLPTTATVQSAILLTAESFVASVEAL
jgi:hypothetical protein